MISLVKDRRSSSSSVWSRCALEGGGSLPLCSSPPLSSPITKVACSMAPSPSTLSGMAISRPPRGPSLLISSFLSTNRGKRRAQLFRLDGISQKSTWPMQAGRALQGSRVLLGKQVMDEKCSLGKSLKRTQIRDLAAKAAAPNGITLVLEGFCMSSCGLHASAPLGKGLNEKFAYIRVGNSETQCPGQCPWPFHQPLYGPQTPPLVAPNGDVGIDGMIINVASLLAGTVTNPFGNGYFQGPATAPMEAASACPGMYGKYSYPGYVGDLLVDSASGASYNANGINGRRYLLPALWNPKTSTCSTLV